MRQRTRNVIKALPLGAGFSVVLTAVTTTPDQLGSNVAAWATWMGFTGLPDWMVLPSADNRVLAWSAVVAVLYAATVWGLPPILRRDTQATGGGPRDKHQVVWAEQRQRVRRERIQIKAMDDDHPGEWEEISTPVDPDLRFGCRFDGGFAEIVVRNKSPETHKGITLKLANYSDPVEPYKPENLQAILPALDGGIAPLEFGPGVQRYFRFARLHRPWFGRRRAVLVSGNSDLRELSGTDIGVKFNLITNDLQETEHWRVTATKQGEFAISRLVRK